MDSRRTETISIETESQNATEQYGRAFGSRIEDGLCISLVGVLGSGKSILARGICRGLGVEEEVLSPTFILFEEYRGRLAVVHIDLYRLEHEAEIEQLGIFDRMGDGSVVLAEWGDRSGKILDASDIVFRLQFLRENVRRIEVRFVPHLAPLFENV
jgi:tRNA threonylcarbamoyladenosine biosynthesis protein TsaE